MPCKGTLQLESVTIKQRVILLAVQEKRTKRLEHVAIHHLVQQPYL